MYHYWNSRHDFGPVFNTSYGFMYNGLIPAAKYTFYQYYASFLIRSAILKKLCPEKNMEQSKNIFLKRYDNYSKFRLIELFSKMKYKDYVLKSNSKVSKILVDKYCQAYDVKQEFFEYIFENPDFYEVIDFDITFKKLRSSEEYDQPVFNVLYKRYRDPFCKNKSLKT